ncbi:hypothetical protein MY3957_004677 [Beauveria namnaoensis]
MPCLEDFLTATPTAELEPVTAEYTQSDEADMGITYAELTAFVHCNDYSPDDNRFDLRPFLYPSFWQSWSFKRIDKELARIGKAREKTQSTL